MTYSGKAFALFGLNLLPLNYEAITEALFKNRILATRARILDNSLAVNQNYRGQTVCAEGGLQSFIVSHGHPKSDSMLADRFSNQVQLFVFGLERSAISHVVTSDPDNLQTIL